MNNFSTIIHEFAKKESNHLLISALNGEITYGDMSLEIQKMATYFDASGICPTAKILLLIDDSINLLKTFFAIVHLGANPVLINIKDIFHVKKIIEIESYDFILYDSEGVSFSLENNNAICVENISLKDENLLPVHEAMNEKVMFSLYTSGTSGQPKYVEKTYQNILTELSFLERKIGISSKNIVLTVVPHIHIYGLLLGVLLPIKVGGTIKESCKILPSHIVKILANADFLIASPVHYESLLKVIDKNSSGSLQLAICSGAPLSLNTANEFYGITGIPILELYGSTETGGIAYRYITDKQENLCCFPHIDVDVSLLEKIKNSNADVVEGELVIRSPSISHNISQDWYHTGDHVRVESNKTFQIIGRQQHLIKFAGKRIFAMQLEEELKTLECIEDVAVVRIDDDSIRAERAVAFVVASKNVTSEDIKKKLQNISSNVSIFYKIFLQKSIIRNHNNKVNYSALQNMAKCRIKSKALKVGIIIPTYNHAYLLDKIIDDCRNYVDEIIIVVDGSTDDTLEKLQHHDVHKVIFVNNRGKGIALKAGFLKAEELGWEYAITFDSDGQHHSHHLLDFVEKVETSPGSIIVGDRDMSALDIPGSSKFGKDFTNFWLKIETGLDVKDGQSGFRLYPIKKINKVKSYFARYEFEVEILARAAWHQIPITSIPIGVEYNPQGGRVSHFRPFVDNARTSILNTILVTIRVLNLFKIVRFKKHE